MTTDDTGPSVDRCPHCGRNTVEGTQVAASFLADKLQIIYTCPECGQEIDRRAYAGRRVR